MHDTPTRAATLPPLRGMAAPGKTPLRAADLRPGAVYLSPSGRKCLLLQSAEHGIACNSYLFAYLTRSGKPSENDGFALSCANAKAIAALQEWRR